VLTFRINLLWNNRKSEEEFAIFRYLYPPNAKKPFAAIVRDLNHEVHLNYDLQRHAPFEMDQSNYCWVTGYNYSGDALCHFIEVDLATILWEDMTFTELRVKKELGDF
jgi:hypothetical protein